MLAGAAVALPSVARHITVMDSAWLEVVRERSEFLFIQLWPPKDLVFNARPFLSLAVTAAALSGIRERRLCVGALLIGATGLLVALIGGTIGPVALLVQGQAWRWEWITCFLAVLLLPQTIGRIWKDEKCGPICSILLICAWTFPVLDGTLCTLLALLLWLIRGHISPLTGRHLRWAALAFAVVVLVWMAATAWNLIISTPPDSGRESIVLTKLRNVLGLGISASVLFGLAWYWTTTRRSARPLLALSALLVAGLSYAVPKSFIQIETLDSDAYLSEFADWRSIIPPNSTVFVAPAQDAGRFVWFALQRPHYLSPDQSAGVVFSRATALEVKRRSEILLPVESPNWRFLSTRSLSAGAKSTPTLPKALTPSTTDGGVPRSAAGLRDGAGYTRHRSAASQRSWQMARLESVRLPKSSQINPGRVMRTITGEMLGYAVASACALVVDVGTLAFLVHFCAWWYLAAASASFMAGLVVAYLISTHFVFKRRRLQNRRIEFLSFAAIGAVGLAVNAVVIFVVVKYAGLNYLVAKGIAAGFTFVCNFISRRQLLFVLPAAA